jgi:hypothetical protein
VKRTNQSVQSQNRKLFRSANDGGPSEFEIKRSTRESVEITANDLIRRSNKRRTCATISAEQKQTNCFQGRSSYLILCEKSRKNGSKSQANKSNWLQATCSFGAQIGNSSLVLTTEDAEKRAKREQSDLTRLTRLQLRAFCFSTNETNYDYLL